MEISKNEQKLIEQIKEKFYMPPLIKGLDEFIKSGGTWKLAFDKIYEILVNGKSAVDEILLNRQSEGNIKNMDQARKSIAGNAFSNLIIYVFLQNKINGLINENVFITNKKSDIKDFNSIATINVDGETQKPDVDLIIYSKNEDGSTKKCAILSLKTSLRERAGQTYKWKLLMEIANYSEQIKSKYNITYNPTCMPLVCFATVNFYNEINNPQNRGMFKFFDKSFIGKEVDSDFICKLSTIVDFVNGDF